MLACPAKARFLWHGSPQHLRPPPLVDAQPQLGFLVWGPQPRPGPVPCRPPVRTRHSSSIALAGAPPRRAFYGEGVKWEGCQAGVTGVGARGKNGYEAVHVDCVRLAGWSEGGFVARLVCVHPKGGEPKQQEESREDPLAGCAPVPVSSATACSPSSRFVVPAAVLCFLLVVRAEALRPMHLGPVWAKAVPVQRGLTLGAAQNQGVIAEGA